MRVNSKATGGPPGRQVGAVSIMVAGALLAVVLSVALAVDVGRIAWEKRHLQLVADLSALEASLAVGNCATPAGSALGIATTAATTAAARNDYDGQPLRVRVGRVDTDADGIRQFSPGPGVVEAVEVVAARDVPRSLFLPGKIAGNHRLTATAVAGTRTIGTLEVGSFLARLDTTTSPLLNAILGGLLGTSINLDAVSYRGIADAHVTLLDLIDADATVGTVDELLNLNLGIRDFVLLAANALSRYPDQRTVAVTLLNVADALTVDADLDLRLGDVLQVALPSTDAALNAQVNVFDLLMVGAQVANAGHAVAVNTSTPGLNALGIADLGLDLYIIEPPQIAIGPAGRDENGEWITRARSAQINLQLHLGLLALLFPPDGLLSLDLYVGAAETRAGFERFECRDDTTPAAVVGAVPQLARIGIGVFDDIEDLNPTITPSPAINLNLLGLPLLTITALAELPLGSSSANPEQLLFEEIPSTQTVSPSLGTSVTTLLQALVDNLVVDFDRSTLLGALLGAILQPVLNLLGLGSSQGLLDLVVNLLSPVIMALDPLLDFLLNLLGLQLGGADITVSDINVGRPGLLR
ncbi:TadG family pilus assembly protein [Thioalbus denitrificans]|uniref:Putative membrane protein n=1 Tax=Thioalbus denitrificans TaxID=547122 RepID=A0A369C9H9_9GAMM|nr:TadG family pilus assembly protein [Thioalbus denitrificans]RCX29785.1 putative membrane protein [Thioalbus denitrificans]